jgi:hypothetical protein
MKNKQNGKFAELFLFAVKAKETMGVYFMVFTVFYLVIGELGGVESVSLDMGKVAQMVGICILIGLGQALIVPLEKFSVPRGVIWVSLSAAVTVGFAILARWFEGFPIWCGIVFCGIMIIGFSAFLLGLLFDTRRETERLNEHLKAYQQELR